MDNVDGSDHYGSATHEVSSSLLAVILDTNPHAWALLKPVLPLSQAVANLLVFINAHLAFDNANRVAIIASHSQRAVWLHPRAHKPKAYEEDTEMKDASSTVVAGGANKYRPFAVIEHDLLAGLRELMASTTEDEVATTYTTQLAGALTLALSYINKVNLAYSDAGISSSKNIVSTVGGEITAQDVPRGLRSRILVISASGDLAHQYIPIMNVTFAAQKLRIPIDILKLAGDTVFLQQSADTTKGTYMKLKNPRGFLQYLMLAFLPDQAARVHLVAPTQDIVDFRAACFCHRNVVDVGFVCSICLSIFCSPPEGATCLTCGTHLALGDYGKKPAVVPRKKKKKKKIINEVETGSAAGTPRSAAGTPAPGE